MPFGRRWSGSRGRARPIPELAPVTTHSFPAMLAGADVMTQTSAEDARRRASGGVPPGDLMVVIISATQLRSV